MPWSETFPPRRSRKEEEEADISLSALLSRVLLMFTIEFDQRSSVPITLCANTIRVLKEDTGVRLGDLPRLTGCSREASDVGWFLKRLVVVESDPGGKRGKVCEVIARGTEGPEGLLSTDERNRKRMGREVWDGQGPEDYGQRLKPYSPCKRTVIRSSGRGWSHQKGSYGPAASLPRWADGTRASRPSREGVTLSNKRSCS